MTRVLLAVCALTPFALTARADEAKIPVKDTFWQQLPGVGWVDLDTNRDPVFHIKEGYYFPKTGKLVAYPKDVTIHRAVLDRAGRVWGLDHNTPCIHFWNGAKWEKLKHNPVQVFEDSVGRVFVFSGYQVHVLGTDGKWTSEDLLKRTQTEGIGFVEQGNRVWLWGSRELPGGKDGMLGVWSFADGKWTHHDTKSGLPFDSVRWMHPLSDGRFFLLADRIGGGVLGSASAFWHPNRKLKDEEKVTIRDPDLHLQHDPAIGVDGTFYINSYHQKAGRQSVVAVTAKGEIREMTAAEADTFRHLPQTLYNRPNTVFAKLGDTPPLLPASDGDYVCTDRDGRHYFRQSGGNWKGYSPGAVVTIAWPKYQKPEEVLQLEKEKRLLMKMTKDDTGAVWAEPIYGGGGLLQWHGGKWIDTAVHPLYHPHWTARPASPWNAWTWNTGHLFRLHGKNGSVLVVRLRDVYQSEDPPEGDPFNPPKPIRDPRFPHPAPPPPLPKGKEQPKYWLEAWLFRDGKWNGPTEIREFLKVNAETLLSDFATTAGEMSYFAFANDGTRLWAAFDGKVVTTDKSGKLIEADWPREKSKNPLPFAMLSNLPDGKVLLSGTLNHAHTLSLSAEGKVLADEFQMPGNHPAANPHSLLAHWKLAKDGTLWYWTANSSGYGGLVWHYRDGKWIEKKDMGPPFHEDAGGNLWCRPRWQSTVALKIPIVNGTETKELVFPAEELKLGFTTIPKDAVVWVWADRIYCLDLNAPGGKPTLRWRLLAESVSTSRIVIDKKGTLLLDSHRATIEK